MLRYRAAGAGAGAALCGGDLVKGDKMLVSLEREPLPRSACGWVGWASRPPDCASRVVRRAPTDVDRERRPAQGRSLRRDACDGGRDAHPTQAYAPDLVANMPVLHRLSVCSLL